MRLANLIHAIVMSPRSVRPNVSIVLAKALRSRRPSVVTGPSRCAPPVRPSSIEGGSFGKHAMHDTASRRASPTSVSLVPARLAIRIAQLFSCEQPKQFARHEF
jgi:hypothetical protein